MTAVTTHIVIGSNMKGKYCIDIFGFFFKEMILGIAQII